MAEPLRIGSIGRSLVSQKHLTHLLFPWAELDLSTLLVFFWVLLQMCQFVFASVLAL